MRRHLLITILFVLTAATFPASVNAPAGGALEANFTAVWGTRSEPDSEPATDPLTEGQSAPQSTGSDK